MVPLPGRLAHRSATCSSQPLFNFVSPYKAFIPHELRTDWILDWLFQGAVYLGVGLLLLPLLARHDRS